MTSPPARISSIRAALRRAGTVLLGSLLVVALEGTSARAQDAPPATAPPSVESMIAPPLPALSSQCQTPGITISGDAPLHNVTNALRLRKTIKILTIGASSKGGKGNSDSSYQTMIESVLEKIIPGLDVKFIDRGISGELARDASARIMTEVALDKPDLVLWQVGTHDALMHVPIDAFKTTVAETLDWLKAHDVDVVMVGLHYLRNFVRDENYQAIRRALKIIVEERRILWIGRYEAMQVIEQARRTNSAGTGSPNEFALTDSGYACLSEYIVRALTSGVYARPPRNPTRPRG